MATPDVMTDEAGFATLDADQLAVLEPFGERRAVVPGEVLFADGDATYDFFVILSPASSTSSAISTARTSSSPSMVRAASSASSTF